MFIRSRHRVLKDITRGLIFAHKYFGEPLFPILHSFIKVLILHNYCCLFELLERVKLFYIFVDAIQRKYLLKVLFMQTMQYRKIFSLKCLQL